jgi:O-antigen/teichoic acid export membrane protein
LNQSPIIQKIKAFLRKIFDKQSRILIRNSSWEFLSNFIKTFLVFARSIVIARGLGVEIYGTYSIVVAFVSTVQEFLNLNIGTTLVKFGAEYKTSERKDKLLALIKGSIFVTIGTSIISILIIIILMSFSYNTFFKIPELHLYIILFAFALSTAFFDYISISILRLFFKFKLNSIIRIVMNIIEFITILSVILIYPKNLRAFFFAVIFARLINSVICNSVAYLELKKKFSGTKNIRIKVIYDDLKKIINFTLNNSVSKTIQTIMNRGDILLLGAMAGPLAVGYYSIAKKLANSILLLTDPLGGAIFPQLSILVSEKKIVEIKKMLKKITGVLSIPASIFLVSTFIFRKTIIEFLFGVEYSNASSPFVFLVFGAVINVVFFWILYLVLSLGMAQLRLKFTFYAIIIGFTVSILLIPIHGATGAAIGLLSSKLIITAFFIYYSNKKLSQLYLNGDI